jgi:hypothetical protein
VGILKAADGSTAYAAGFCSFGHFDFYKRQSCGGLAQIWFPKNYGGVTLKARIFTLDVNLPLQRSPGSTKLGRRNYMGNISKMLIRRWSIQEFGVL